MIYRRRLPHVYETEQPVFLTLRLHDSLPPHRAFPTDALNSGQASATMDRLLDEACGGPLYLRQPAVADMIVEGIQCNARLPGALSHTCLRDHAKPRPFTGSFRRGIAQTDEIVERYHRQARQRDVGIDGGPFLTGRESFDHLMRHAREFERIRNYIEGNPVRAGLVRQSREYRWSSAGWPTGGSAADEGVRPTVGQ